MLDRDVFDRVAVTVALVFVLAFAGTFESMGITANAVKYKFFYAPEGNLYVSISNEGYSEGVNRYELKVRNKNVTNLWYSRYYIAPLKVSKKDIATLGKWEKSEGTSTPVKVNPSKINYFAVRCNNEITYVALYPADILKVKCSIDYPEDKYDENAFNSANMPILNVYSPKHGCYLDSFKYSVRGYTYQNKFTKINNNICRGESIKYSDGAGYVVVSPQDDPLENYDGYIPSYGSFQYATLKGTDQRIRIENIGCADSKIAKFKLSKKPKAPVASINYLTGTATIPKGCSYRITSISGKTIISGDSNGIMYEGMASFNATAASSSKYTIENLSSYGDGEGVVEVVKKTAGKRVSKTRAIPFYTAKPYNLESKDLSFSETYNTKSQTYDITIKNASMEAYEVYAKGKWVKIPSAKLKSDNKKYGSKKVTGFTSGDAVRVRVPGNAMLLQLPSEACDAYRVRGVTAVKAICVASSADASSETKGTGKISISLKKYTKTGEWIDAKDISGKKIIYVDQKAYDVVDGVVIVAGLKSGEHTVSVKWDKRLAKIYGDVESQTVVIGYNS